MSDPLTVERDGPRVVITLHLADDYAAMRLCDTLARDTARGLPVVVTVPVHAEVGDA